VCINGIELQVIETGLTSVRNNCKKRIATKRRNQDIFRARYGLTSHPKKLAEIGEQFNLSAERVRQICAAVVWALHKEESNIPGLKEALGKLLKEVSHVRKYHKNMSVMPIM